MDRCNVGVVLGVISGVVSFLESSIFFSLRISSVKTVEYLVAWYLVAWYLVAVGLALVILLAALTVYKGRKVLGGAVMFVTSLSLPVNFILLLIPAPVGSMIRVLYYHPLPASGWLLLSMIGGIIILSVKNEASRMK